MAKKNIKNIKDIFDNFDDLIKDKESPFADFFPKESKSESEFELEEKLDREELEEIGPKEKVAVKFYADKKITNGGILTLAILFGMLAMAIPAIIELNFNGLDLLAKIVRLVIGGLGVWSIIGLSKRKIFVAEFLDEKINFMVDVPVGNVIANHIYVYRSLRNKFKRIEVPLEDVVALRANKGALSDGVIFLFADDGSGKVVPISTAFRMLEEKDLNALIDLLKKEGVRDFDV